MKIRGQTVYEPKERILRMITVLDNGCWNWNGAKRNGYGRLIIGSRRDNTRHSESAHRYSWLSYMGSIPDGMYVCHKCDNPSCVNPNHLFLGTFQDNINDRESKDRNNHVVGERVPTSKFTPEDVRNIRVSNISSRQLAKDYGVNKSSIQAIKNNKSWRHLLPIPPEVNNE